MRLNWNDATLVQHARHVPSATALPTVICKRNYFADANTFTFILPTPIKYHETWTGSLTYTCARRLMTFAYLSYCNCTRTTMSQRTSSEHGEAWRYYHRSPLFRQLEGGGLSNQLIITRYLLIYIRHIHVEDFRTERDFRTTVVPLATVPSLCICLW